MYLINQKGPVSDRCNYDFDIETGKIDSYNAHRRFRHCGKSVFYFYRVGEYKSISVSFDITDTQRIELTLDPSYVMDKIIMPLIKELKHEDIIRPSDITDSFDLTLDGVIHSAFYEFRVLYDQIK